MKHDPMIGRKIFWTMFFILVLSLIAYCKEHKRNQVNRNKCDITSSFDVALPSILDNRRNEVISHKYYVLGYNEDHEQPNWVQYLACKAQVNGDIRRDATFTEDPSVSTGSSKSADYNRSGYDRGHLCPAADMRMNNTSMKETFYMSNISPQTHQFNAGIWLDIENHVRDLVNQYDSLYVVTGPVLEKGLPKVNGKYNSISVPKQFYKIVYSPKGNWMTGYLVPHSVNYKNKKSIDTYVVSVDQIEELAYIDFFKGIPNEELLEKSK